MRTTLTIFSILLINSLSLLSQIAVYHPQIPVMVERSRNIVTQICVDNSEGKMTTFNSLEGTVKIKGADKIFREVALVYTGGTSMLKEQTTSQALNDAFKRIGGSQQIYASPRYSIQNSTSVLGKNGAFKIGTNQSLVRGKNYFYISLSVDQLNNLTDTFALEVNKINIDGSSVPFDQKGNAVKRFGIGVRNHGDDDVYSYRIPGLVTTKKGSLLAVYDVRYNTSLDLQDDIDVGLSRSTDGGRSWEKMRIIMDMGQYMGLTEGENGIGDPSILVDEVTGDILVVAVWTHGIGGNRAWTNSGQGLELDQTAQLMLTRSSDDGKSWSTPVNITKQVKDSTWRFLLQGPGRGITMDDGTLVFPIQYIDSLKMPRSAIMYSKDRGNTWSTHLAPKDNTTEAQVVEVTPGVLMLNMRDNTRKGRAIFTTKDLGRSWEAHPTSNKALIEPVCMASLYKIGAGDSPIKKPIFLFSNPNESKPSKRWKMTIKSSTDDANTWPEAHQLLIDEEHGWGYSCLTMIDKNTVGIIYEGSTGQLVFQAIPLRAIVKY